MTDNKQLASGAPVPADRSHTELKANGQQKDYVVLSPEERSRGFVKPVRRSYKHSCGVVTKMSADIAETYARDPKFYDGTFCCGCGEHFPLMEFRWEPDGEPMEPVLQEAWAQRQDDAKQAIRAYEIRQRDREKLVVMLKSAEDIVELLRAEIVRFDEGD